jgi:hypothetical protein
VAARVRVVYARGQTQAVCASRCWRRRRTRVDDSWERAHGGARAVAAVQGRAEQSSAQRSLRSCRAAWYMQARMRPRLVGCESRWTQGVVEDGEVEALGQAARRMTKRSRSGLEAGAAITPQAPLYAAVGCCCCCSIACSLSQSVHEERRRFLQVRAASRGSARSTAIRYSNRNR